MARLPLPGGDSGNWGDILNDYLSQAHKGDGKLKDNTVNTSQLQDDAVTASKIVTGAVTKTDVGLGNVDNTADADKPVSTATQTALNTKLNTADLDSQTAVKVQDPASATAAALSATIANALGVGAINAWQTWGDSLTADSASSGFWENKFTAMNSFAASTFNIAQPGETSAQQLNRIVTQGGTVRDRKFTICVGRNDLNQGVSPFAIVNNIRLMLAEFDAPRDGFIFDVPPATDDTDAERAALLVTNELIQMTWPEMYLPIFSLLRTPIGAQAAEVVLTPTDLSDIADGNTPGSLRSDAVHVNDAGGTAIAYFVQRAAYLREKVTAVPVLPSALGPNLITNPDFEVDTTGWVGVGSPVAATISRTTAEQHSGAASLEVQFSSSTGSGAELATRPSVAPSKVLTGKLWVKGPIGEVHQVRLTTYNAVPTALAFIDSPATTLTGDWQEITATGTTGATAASANMKLIKAGASVSNTPLVFVDDAQMYQPV